MFSSLAVAVACKWRHVRVTTTTLSGDVVPVDKPDDVNVVIGQAHFIKTVEDLHVGSGGIEEARQSIPLPFGPPSIELPAAPGPPEGEPCRTTVAPVSADIFHVSSIPVAQRR